MEVLNILEIARKHVDTWELDCFVNGVFLMKCHPLLESNHFFHRRRDVKNSDLSKVTEMTETLNIFNITIYSISVIYGLYKLLCFIVQGSIE